MLAPAGASWCALYPTSRDVADLADPFRGRVVAFFAELARRGVTPRITATRRPSERAWLMHWAWMIAKEDVDPATVPPHDPPIPIAWTVEGAAAMVAGYRLVHQPSLTSRHIDGLAIDVGSFDGWKGSNAQLYDLGAQFGVHKLVSDPPHWSSDGR